MNNCLRYVARAGVCIGMAALILLSVNSEAARRRRNTTTSTSRQSVTQATREAAINASKKNGENSVLLQIEVDKPDLEAIRVATLDPKSKYYFPDLMDRYVHSDTTMTLDEYRHLYLGYMFQEDYDPYRMSPYAQIADSLRQKLETVPKDDIKLRRQLGKEIEKYVDKALDDNPFDLRQMSLYVHLMRDKEKTMRAKKWEYRLEHFLAAIKSTGTGENEENAWFVIYPMHEYDIVQLLGYEATDMEYIDPGIDHLFVQPDGTVKLKNPAKGFYFNVYVPQQQYMLKYEEEGEEGDN